MKTIGILGGIKKSDRRYLYALALGKSPVGAVQDEFYTEYTPVPSVKIAQFDNDRLPFSRTFEFKLFISFVCV